MFWESVKMAIQAIRSNKMRSALTMLGIIIGIASVIAIVGIGDAVKGSMNKEFESFGLNRGYVYLAGQGDTFDSDMINAEDVELISRVYADKIDGIMPYLTATQTFADRKKNINVSLTGVNEKYNKITKVTMTKGRFIVAEDVNSGRNVAVLEQKSVKKIFPNDSNPVGKVFTLNNADQSTSTYLLIGIYKEPASMLAGMMGETFSMLVPYTYIEGNLTMGSGGYYALDIGVKQGVDVDQTMKEIVSLVEKRHGNADRKMYGVQTAESQMGTINNVLGMLQTFIGAIAAISLVVGGIGIMNIMLVSVTERTREIGIRKAIGANNKDIMIQFIIESVILSCIGGLIGITLGVSIAGIAVVIMKMKLVVQPMVILFTWVFSASIGIFFGYYPARKAAQLDPIDALRYE